MCYSLSLTYQTKRFYDSTSKGFYTKYRLLLSHWHYLPYYASFFRKRACKLLEFKSKSVTGTTIQFFLPEVVGKEVYITHRTCGSTINLSAVETLYLDYHGSVLDYNQTGIGHYKKQACIIDVETTDADEQICIKTEQSLLGDGCRLKFKWHEGARDFMLFGLSVSELCIVHKVEPKIELGSSGLYIYSLLASSFVL